ncbi:amidase [Ramlibacter albus]|uniref:Amidase n=1 Tax=Ramlibacter albus TaxID=2079448 RepID=A0A923M9R8_9BURK|nr:amidase [Ramlibacter albus]MBC5765970.1 amidase [Ramlibacter albus]
MTQLWRLDAAQLVQGYARGDFTPGEALDACLARLAATKALNAVIAEDRAGATVAAHASEARWKRGEPLGPLDGIPLTLKDNLHAAGLPTTWGSRLLEGFVPRDDELPVARLRAAGAVIFGKTNTPEFAMQGYTDNHVHGVTRNPWDPRLTPGGSSGGAAAAVAAGCGPLALATDGGGSIRRPASYCGLVGFKPSAGRVARGGGLPEIFLHFEVPGALGRTVADVHRLVEVVAGEAAATLRPPPAARILYVPRFGAHPVDPGIASCVSAAARHLQALGHAIDEAPTFDIAERVNAAWPTLSGAGLAWMLKDASAFAEFGLAAGETPDVSRCMPAIRNGLREAQASDAAALFEALAAVHALERDLAVLFTRSDFILTPAAAAMPWPAEEPWPTRIAGQEVAPRGHAVFTAFANAAGLPAIALPCGVVDGLPVGLHLVAARGQDAQLLALAAQYEHAQPWGDRRPP